MLISESRKNGRQEYLMFGGYKGLFDFEAVTAHKSAAIDESDSNARATAVFK
jgi:hypothetical protein